MYYKRIVYLLISIFLCSLLSGYTWSGIRKGSQVKTIALAPAVAYPTRIFAPHCRTVCLDLELGPGLSEPQALTLDIPHLAQGAHGFAYTNAKGEHRYCINLELLPEVRPGGYTIPITLSFAKGVKAFASAHIEIAKPKSAAAGDPGHKGLPAELPAVSGAPVTTGNQIQILDNGPEAFTAWYELIASAKKSIYLQTYYLNDEGQCSKLVDLLKVKASQGVEVYLITTLYTQLSVSPLAYLDLKFHGIKCILIGDIGFPRKVANFTTPWYQRMVADYRIYKAMPAETPFSLWGDKKGKGQFMIDYALHEKMLIVDGERAIAGGRNLGDCYFFWWQDLDFLCTGPIVDELGKTFSANWQTFEGEPLPVAQERPAVSPKPGVTALLVQSHPWDGRYTNLDALVSAIDMAHAQVFITSQYLSLPDKLKDALCAAAARGVDVRILTNSLETGQEVAMSLCHFISLNYYPDLLKAGVRIYEYGCDPKLKFKPYFHAKEFMLDDVCTAMGSMNLSLRSAYLESELMVYVFDKDLTRGRKARFLTELDQHAREISFSDLAHKQQDYGRLIALAHRVEILY